MRHRTTDRRTAESAGADIAFRDSTEQCIGHRVHRDVGVGMSFQSMGMIDSDPAKDDMIAVDEGVNVKTCAYTEFVGGVFSHALGLLEIVYSGNLEVVFAAAH